MTKKKEVQEADKRLKAEREAIKEQRRRALLALVGEDRAPVATQHRGLVLAAPPPPLDVKLAEMRAAMMAQHRAQMQSALAVQTADAAQCQVQLEAAELQVTELQAQSEQLTRDLKEGRECSEQQQAELRRMRNSVKCLPAGMQARLFAPKPESSRGLSGVRTSRPALEYTLQEDPMVVFCAEMNAEHKRKREAAAADAVAAAEAAEAAKRQRFRVAAPRTDEAVHERIRQSEAARTRLEYEEGKRLLQERERAEALEREKVYAAERAALKARVRARAAAEAAARPVIHPPCRTQPEHRRAATRAEAQLMDGLIAMAGTTRE